MMRGFFAIGIVHGKKGHNTGSLLRSAHALGAAFVFTVGKRYDKETTDTTRAMRHVPLFHFRTVAELKERMPRDARLIGVEIDPRACPLSRFVHPERAVYLLGAEDRGLNESERAACNVLVQVDASTLCLNVAVAGAIVMWHRRGTARSSPATAANARAA